MRLLNVIAGLVPPAGVALLYAALLWAPTEAFMGDVQRIFYIHVSMAWSAYLCFTVVLVASIVYLRSRKAQWDQLAYGAGEVGTLFTTATLLSGTFWARAVWGQWWTWEPRLTLTLVTWLMYIGYLILRQAIADDDTKARTASIFGILAFFNIPLVHFSVQWWRSIHPFTIGAGHNALHPDMRVALMVATVAATLLAVTLLTVRYRTATLAARAEQLAVADETVGG